MDNYKIKVKDEAESKEAQELFFEFGYSWQGCGKYYNRIGNYAFITAYPDEMLLRMGWGGDTDKELTLPQLRDLVVLKRGDVKDANHRDKQQNSIYLTSDKVIYYWQGEWCKSAINKSNDYENYIANSLTPITQPQDPALISGAEAELVAQAKKFITSDHLNRFEAAEAHLEGHPVQFMLANGDFIDITSDTTLGIFEKDGGYSFRLKPQTIKLELELPKPFEPEEDCHVYILDDGKTDGYRRYSYEVHGDKGNTFIGIWRTEAEVKQVVEQLRKIRGAS
ncbi:hypothetical protein ACTZ9G_002837 [Acinetobacter baumannii]|uniref:hypothetical protein n=1 Tax=Acinetobacter baumannii TaxID=470 RepID=UPI00186457E6|nr:hypothetical protein [Acinetobacter baumannii]EIJ7450252.1 hypothetical protein [Acinetobacter baumannii]EJF1105665.1 hypothetical protein [Acinetobacter baumannii]EKT8552746.1 hypothetical protein [Acinetobacter baumannii]EKT9210198.1 hypothetical protein [Acinetobacter baumannii]